MLWTRVLHDWSFADHRWNYLHIASNVQFDLLLAIVRRGTENPIADDFQNINAHVILLW